MFPDRIAHPVEGIRLSPCKRVVCRFTAGREVREHGADTEWQAFPEQVDQFTQIRFHKTKAVHAGIQFDVHGILADMFMLQVMPERLEDIEGINFRLEFVLNQVIESCFRGVHNHDG